MNVGIQTGSLRFSRRVVDLETDTGVGLGSPGASFSLVVGMIRESRVPSRNRNYDSETGRKLNKCEQEVSHMRTLRTRVCVPGERLLKRLVETHPPSWWPGKRQAVEAEGEKRERRPSGLQAFDVSDDVFLG